MPSKCIASGTAMPWQEVVMPGASFGRGFDGTRSWMPRLGIDVQSKELLGEIYISSRFGINARGLRHPPICHRSVPDE